MLFYFLLLMSISLILSCAVITHFVKSDELSASLKTLNMTISKCSRTAYLLIHGPWLIHCSVLFKA